MESLPVIGAIVQARMSSQRLPGKVLLPIHGRPLLAYLIDRLQRAEQLGLVVIATSASEDDDPIAEFAGEIQVPCFRGSLEDVAERVVDAAEANDIEVLVRTSGDSPFLDQRLVDKGVRLFLSSRCHLVTNVHPRTFPTGQSIEVMRTATLRDAHAYMTATHHLEHVTAYFYEHAQEFDIVNFSHEPSLANRRMTVDEPSDVAVAERLFDALSRPHWDYSLEELIALGVIG